MARYNSVLAKFLTAGDEEWEAIVAVHRPDLQKPFFEHMQCLIAAARDDAEKKEQLVMINTRLVALCANYDSVGADQEALEQAAEVYRDLLSSISSIEEADKKMAELAGAGKIDPAFLQISAKAYGAARDTNMTLDEVRRRGWCWCWCNVYACSAGRGWARGGARIWLGCHGQAWRPGWW